MLTRAYFITTSLQGTNAHVVLGRSSQGNSWNGVSAKWERKTHWAQLHTHSLMIQRCSRVALSSSSLTVTMQGALGHPGLHPLNSAKCYGKPVFPSGCILDCAGAAGQAITGHGRKVVCLCDVAIPAAASQSPTHESELVVTLAATAGQLHINAGLSTHSEPSEQQLLRAQISHAAGKTGYSKRQSSFASSSVLLFGGSKAKVEGGAIQEVSCGKSSLNISPAVAVEAAVASDVTFSPGGPPKLTSHIDFVYLEANSSPEGSAYMQLYRTASGSSDLRSENSSCLLEGTAVKSIQATQRADPVDSAAASTMLQLCWKATDMIVPDSSSCQPGHISLDGAGSVAASLAVIQAAQTSKCGLALELQSFGRHDGRDLRASALSGFLRTCALENGDLAVTGGQDIATGCFGLGFGGTRFTCSKPAMPFVSNPNGIKIEPGIAMAPQLENCVGISNELPTDHGYVDSAPNYVITGGTGLLGGLSAKWLSERYHPRHTLLIGRSGRGGALHQNLQMTPAVVETTKCDMSSCEDRAAMLMDLCTGQLGLLHAGGVLEDATICNQTSAGMRAVFAPKVDAILGWQQQAACAPLAAQILFSSIAALWGSPGQLQYSAANSVLDGLAASWKRQGRIGTSINWGAWSGGGMASKDPGTAGRLEKLGLGMVSPSSGLQALSVLMSHRGLLSSVAVTPFNARLFSKHLAPGSAELVKGLLQEAPVLDPALEAVDNVPMIFESREEAGPRSSSQDVLQQVLSCTESILGSRPDLSTPLTAAGIDSLGAVELRNILQEQFSIELAATVLYDYPTVEEISGHVASLCSLPSQDRSTPEHKTRALSSLSAMQPTSACQQMSNTKTVEVLHSVCRTPQDAVAALETVDTIQLIPPSKWDIDAEMRINQTSSGR